MAWQRTSESEVTWADIRSNLGGFGRAGTTAQTYLGPVYSPDGTAWYIVVDNAGVVSATSTKP